MSKCLVAITCLKLKYKHQSHTSFFVLFNQKETKVTSVTAALFLYLTMNTLHGRLFFCLCTSFEIRLGSWQMSRFLPRHIYVFQYLPRKLNDDDNDVFQINFKLDFMTQIIHCIIHNFCILFPYFRSPITVSKKRDTERMLILPYSQKWQKFNKMNERKSQGYQSVGAEYVAESDKAFSQRPQKIFQPFIRIGTVSSGSYKNLLNILGEP